MSSREGSGYPIGRIIFASGLGTMIEWYDFYIFGSLAVVMSQVMFPKDPTWALIALWLLGYPDRAVERGRRGLNMADATGRPKGRVTTSEEGSRLGRPPSWLPRLAATGAARRSA